MKEKRKLKVFYMQLSGLTSESCEKYTAKKFNYTMLFMRYNIYSNNYIATQQINPPTKNTYIWNCGILGNSTAT